MVKPGDPLPTLRMYLGGCGPFPDPPLVPKLLFLLMLMLMLMLMLGLARLGSARRLG
jgi:hypothetical protein